MSHSNGKTPPLMLSIEATLLADGSSNVKVRGAESIPPEMAKILVSGFLKHLEERIVKAIGTAEPSTIMAMPSPSDSLRNLRM